MLKKNVLQAFSYVQRYIGKGKERSIKAKKNILGSLVIKGLSIIISFVLVPLTINYVNPSKYGIWLTLSSIVAWFSFFDIGITHGLRNKFAEAKAKDDDEGAQIYVSTTYGILAIIFIVIWLVFLLVNPFLDWTAMLNLSSEYKSDVTSLALIVFTYFCLQFILRTVTTVITADQQPAKASLIDLIGQLVSLIIIVILVQTTEGSLVLLGLALCVAPLLALLVANAFFFRGKYHAYRPVYSKIRLKYAKSLFNLGVIFFIIQIAQIVQFQSANIIIARSFGPTEVTSYNIAYKYFGILNIVFVIFLTPFWSASTEAYMKKDMAWIKNSVKKYNYLVVAFVAAGILMLFFADTFYDLWLGKGTISIEFSLSLWCFIYFACSMFAGIYVSFLNGISALRLQFWASIVSPLVYIAIALFFIKYYKMGVYALFLASVIANFNGIILAPLQYYMIVVKNKKGIWIK